MQLSELIEVMQKSGVVGAGGAGFPSYAKLDSRADTIILNCAECEPLLKLHRQVMEKYAHEIISTLSLIADTVEAERVIIAIKGSYKSAVAAAEAQLSAFPKVQIGILPEIYPAGDEVITIYETTGRVVPPGGLPIMVGVTVFNVETILNVYRGLNGIPVTEKYITVAGEVKNPVTLKVPIGITVEETVALAGGVTTENPAYISGGPMTGILTTPYDRITKTSNAILVMPENHYIVSKRKVNTSIDMKRAMSVCCQCQMCTDLCPRNLLGHPIEPHAFMRSATSGTTKDLKPFINTMFCSQCGLCEMYSCGQGLNPRTLIGKCKSGLRAQGIPVPKDIQADEVGRERENRRVPMSRLTARLGLSPYNTPAPLKDELVKTDCVHIKLSQHIGAPAVPIVKVKEKVSAGQMIGEAAQGKLSVPVHASIGGTVTEITDSYITIQA